MLGFRRNFTLLLFLFLVLISFSYSSSDAWIGWAVIAFLVFFWFIIDLLFFNSNNFLYEPSTHSAWELRVKQIKQA